MSEHLRDVVIVGGGPIGLFSAVLAADAGLSVTVIESRTEPIDKACGEGLMWSAVQRLAAIDVHPVGRDFQGITYLDAAGRTRAYAPFGDHPGRGVQRVVLQESLTVRAKEANVRRIQARVTGLTQSENEACVLLQGGTQIRGRYVVGADGLHSTVRAEIGLKPKPSRRPRYGLRQHFLAEPWNFAVEVYWASASEAYVTPVSDDVVGVAILGERDGRTFTDRLDSFPALRERLQDARPVGSVAGAGPLRQRVKGRVRGRAVLVGDAAGYVDALTGEGLAVGFESAAAAISAIKAGRLSDYESQWPRITREYRWLTESLVAATRSPTARRLLVRSASRFPGVFSAAVSRLA